MHQRRGTEEQLAQRFVPFLGKEKHNGFLDNTNNSRKSEILFVPSSKDWSSLAQIYESFRREI